MASEWSENLNPVVTFIRPIAQDVADAHGIKFDAERDAADAQKVKDETEFVKEFLGDHERVKTMAENVESMAGIVEYLKPEFETWLSDKDHDENYWTD